MNIFFKFLFLALNIVIASGIGVQSDWDIQGKVGYLCVDGPEKEDYPSCDCLKNMPIIGNLAVGPPDIPYSGDVAGFENEKSVPSILSSNNLIIPSGSVEIDGLECMENNETKTLNKQLVYMLNVEYTGSEIQDNNYVKFKNLKSGELKLTYLKNITRRDSLRIVAGDLKMNDETVETMGPEDNLCGPARDGKLKDLVWPILRLILFNGQRCPIQKGTSVVIKNNNPITLMMEERLKCGNYKLNVNINGLEAPEIFNELTLEWKVSENLHCE